MSGPATLMRVDEQDLDGLLDMIADLEIADAVMAEVGVYAGEASHQFLLSGKVRQLFAVDRWQDFSQDGEPWQSPYDWDEVRGSFADVQGLWFPRLVAMPVDSLTAAECFPDRSLDLVYIDANHGCDAVRADIRAWYPKVRYGGYLAGHDFDPVKYPGVARAVDELCGTVAVRRYRDTSWLVRL